MAKPRQITFGNLVITDRGETVEVRLNTYHKGVPVALFLPDELRRLAEKLKGFVAAPPPEDDWSDLV